MVSEITLKGKCDFEDKGAREAVIRLDTKVATINERTKMHTIEIRELRKMIKAISDK